MPKQYQHAENPQHPHDEISYNDNNKNTKTIIPNIGMVNSNSKRKQKLLYNNFRSQSLVKVFDWVGFYTEGHGFKTHSHLLFRVRYKESMWCIITSSQKGFRVRGRVRAYNISWGLNHQLKLLVIVELVPSQNLLLSTLKDDIKSLLEYITYHEGSMKSLK